MAIEHRRNKKAVDEARRGVKGKARMDGGTTESRNSAEVLPPPSPGWERQAPIPMSQWTEEMFESNAHQRVVGG